jgi:ABC-type transport system involved in multi-copper enzyme maturation permease subunit
MRLFVSTLQKLRRRPATWITFAVLAALLVLILLAVSGASRLPQQGEQPRFDPLTLVTFPGAYTEILGFVLGLGGLFAVIFGAAVAGSEWSWGTFKAVVARGESRTLYMVATFAATLLVIAIGLLVTYVVGIAGGAVASTLAGVSLAGMSDATALGNLPELFARGMVGIAAQAALGFAIATLARSQLAGIGAGIALYFVGSFALLFLPQVVKYLPFQLANSALDIGGPGLGGGGGALAESARVEPNLALVLLVVWLVGALVVAAGFSERAEVLG